MLETLSTPPKKGPQINVNVEVHATPIGENMFEVVLNIKVESKADDEKSVLSIIEVSYAGIFTLPSIKEGKGHDEQLKRLLLVECPRHLFPFARSIISDITKESGMAPTVLAPFDFEILYHNQIN